MKSTAYVWHFWCFFCSAFLYTNYCITASIWETRICSNFDPNSECYCCFCDSTLSFYVLPYRTPPPLRQHRLRRLETRVPALAPSMAPPLQVEVVLMRNRFVYQVLFTLMKLCLSFPTYAYRSMEQTIILPKIISCKHKFGKLIQVLFPIHNY